jgi:putative ABC transport system permease protein
MNFTDVIALAFRNLRQALLRTALTVIGVVIGVAAIVTMVSFGLGLQDNIINKTFARLDVFTAINVFGPGTESLIEMSERRPADASGEKESSSESKTGNNELEKTPPENSDKASDNQQANANEAQADVQVHTRVLDDEAVAEISRISGVRYVLPQVNFSCYTRFDNRTRRLNFSGAPENIDHHPHFQKFLAGGYFSQPNAREIIVSESFVSIFNKPVRNRRRFIPKKSEPERMAEASHLIGREITLLTLPQSAAAPDSIFGIPLIDTSANTGHELARNNEDSQFEQQVFRIVGVLPADEAFTPLALLRANAYVPLIYARRFREANRPPMERVGQSLVGDSGYPGAEVRVIDPVQVKVIQEQIETLGFRAFSLNNQVERIRRVFLIVNGGLALLGSIALLVASFGIANTMLMSILERTREIGIMKAIGGADHEIMQIFFIEAGLIGLIGGLLGVIAGYFIDRIANLIVNRWLIEGGEPIEFFSLPWYLWGGAIVFAILISMLAALYPALRAARVDPIRALRHD